MTLTGQMSVEETRPASDDALAARRAMIDSQLRPSGVNEPRVLAAFMRVAREDFVPEAVRAAAYMDRAVTLQDGRALAAPLVHGQMLQEAVPAAADKTLVVGHNGYLGALVAPMVGSLDCVAPEQAAGGNGNDYSLILIDGAIEQLPAGIAAQLAENGRLVTGVVENGVTRLAVGRKVNGTVALMPVSDMGIPVLPEFAAPKRWSFAG